MHEPEIESAFSEIQRRLGQLESRMEQTVKEQAYRLALWNALDVLNETRGSFRSKKLQSLRERIESVLRA